MKMVRNSMLAAAAGALISPALMAADVAGPSGSAFVSDEYLSTAPADLAISHPAVGFIIEAEYAVGDIIELAFTGNALDDSTLPSSIVSAGSPAVVTVGLLSSDSGQATYRVTEVNTGGGNSTVDAFFNLCAVACEFNSHAIDAANGEDPRLDDGQPEALLYGQRMSAECNRLFPEGSDVLKIATRGQHIERWVLKRADYPVGRTGYLTWRRDLADHHAKRVGEIMERLGYSEEDIAQAERMLRKQGIKRDTEVQALEDVICFTFLKWYFAPFTAKHTPEKVQGIVEKTARKMSPEARTRVLAEFDLPDYLAAAFDQ